MPAKSFASENVSVSNYKTTSFSHPSLLTVGSVHSGVEIAKTDDDSAFWPICLCNFRPLKFAVTEHQTV